MDTESMHVNGSISQPTSFDILSAEFLRYIKHLPGTDAMTNPLPIDTGHSTCSS